MAVLENLQTGEKVSLRSHHVFGRRLHGCDTIIQEKSVSQLHCVIRWENQHWVINDLSRNGTWVDDERLIKEVNHTIKLDQVFRLGECTALWRVIDLRAPSTVLVPLQNNSDIIDLNKFYVLPNETNPEVTLFMDRSNTWFCEDKEGVRLLKDGEIIRYQEDLWRFFSNQAIDTTVDLILEDENDSLQFLFKVSLDEEHVFVNIKGKKEYNLGERVHHYLLLILARRKLEDQKNQITEDAQGWIELESLSKMIGVDRAHLNIQIYRARKQISQDLEELTHLPNVFERRSGSIRFGIQQFQINKGGSVESYPDSD